MAYTASAMWGAACVDGLLEGVLPNDPPFALVPVIAALVMFCLLVTVGPRLPRRCLAMLGPLGVAAISYALSQAPGAGDGAVLYTMPVLWTTVFYGRKGAVAILGCVAAGHAATLMLLPPSSVYPGRWLDVMVSVAASAIVVLALEGRNQALLGRLAAEARTDPLTGLLNRRGLEERAAVEIAHARRDNSPIALAGFDLDYFKRINDEWGHQTGDRVLVHLARLLMGEARDIDTVARVGGEEFVVLLPDTDLAGARAFTDRVRAGLAAAPAAELPSIRVSAGIVASASPDELSTLLQRADSALYAAKRGGRDRTMPWADGFEQRVAA
jgi:diguanylate cyclase (GGDEF)-like protein